jgi:hypothetical protein
LGTQTFWICVHGCTSALFGTSLQLPRNTNYIDLFSMGWYTRDGHQVEDRACTCLHYRAFFHLCHTHQRHPRANRISSYLRVKMETMHDLLAPAISDLSVSTLKKKPMWDKRPFRKSRATTHTQVHSDQNRHRRPKHSRYHYKLADSRKIWERVMGTTHPSPQAYKETRVLLLGWTEECDDTGTASEVSLNRKTKQCAST